MLYRHACVVQKKGFAKKGFEKPLFFCANQRTWINKVLTHACVNVLCKKKNRKLAPFFNLYKERKKPRILTVDEES